jgi:integrase
VIRLVAGGLFLVVAAEVLALVLAAGRWVLPIAGLAVAVFLLAARLSFAGAQQRPLAEAATDDPAEALRRWRSRTESTIQWADSTREDWDRHLRPQLAREFVLATRQRDPVALQATGRIVFGEDLWGWVDPNNVARGRGRDPGPGYATLEEILRRMEDI